MPAQPRSRHEPGGRIPPTRSSTDDGEARTRVRNSVRPADAMLPDGTGTLTRDEYYEFREKEEKARKQRELHASRTRKS